MTFNMGTVPSFDDFKFDTVVNVGSAFWINIFTKLLF
jgi:hypothetical protein